MTEQSDEDAAGLFFRGAHVVGDRGAGEGERGLVSGAVVDTSGCRVRVGSYDERGIPRG